jgi:hypothetical protein
LLALVLVTIYYFSRTGPGPKNAGEILTDTTTCNDIPFPSPEARSKDSTGYYAGDTIIFRSGLSGNHPAITRKLWVIDTDTLFDQDADTLTHRFETPGNYVVSFVAVAGNILSPCTRIADLNLRIDDKSARKYALVVKQSGPAIEPQRSLNVLWSLILLGSGSVCLVMVALSQKMQRKKETSAKEPPEVIKDPTTQAGPPYEIPFENNAKRLVFTERPMNEVFRTMRQKTMDELEILNVSKTIRKTIRAGGYPELIYSNQLKHRDFLILVDRSNPRNLQASLFDYLVELYKEQNISVERYYYQDSFQKCTNEQYPQGISLRRLSELYRYHTLIIAGNCHELVYKGYAVIEKKLLETLSEWEYKAILTPVPFKDWGSQENLIRKYMILLPADVEGQQRLIPAIEERQLAQQAYLSSVKSWYETSWVDFTDTGEIMEYLDDEVLFQWVCALAVYPKLRWEVLVEVGYHVLDQYHQTEKLNFTNLLKVCRISWMRDGSIPERTRLELMKSLTENNERVTRITLLNMFAYADNFYKGSHFFEEEKEMQKLTNQFLLYSNDPVQHASFNSAHEKFKQLWKNKHVTDAPLRMYIDKKPGDVWQTLLKSDEKHVGIEEYISAAVPGTPGKKKKLNLWLKAAAVIFFGSWVLLYFFKDNLAGNRLANFLRISTVNSRGMLSLHMIMHPVVDCENSVRRAPQRISRANGFLTFTDSTYAFEVTPSLDGKDSVYDAVLQVPYYRIDEATANLSITWNEVNTTQQVVTFTNQDLSVRVSDCTPEQAETVVIPVDTSRYAEELKETTMPSSMNEIWIGSRNNRLVTVDVNKRIIYYSTGDKKTYGMYRIQNVYQTVSGAYKLVSTADNQYMVSFARNVQPNAFELSICPTRVNTIEETAEIDEKTCDQFDRMKIYYENDAAGLRTSQPRPHVFTRFRSDDLTGSQRKKLQDIMANALDERNYGITFNFVLRKNSFYAERPNFKDNSRISRLINFASSSSKLSVTTIAAGPFDRDVLVLQSITGGERAPESTGPPPNQSPVQQQNPVKQDTTPVYQQQAPMKQENKILPPKADSTTNKNNMPPPKNEQRNRPSTNY